MANSTSGKMKAEEQLSMMAVVAPAVGWLIPGAGHIIQKLSLIHISEPTRP